MARISKVSTIAKRYMAAFVGVVVLVGLLIYFSPQDPEPAESIAQSEQHRGDRRSPSHQEGPDNGAASKEMPNHGQATPVVKKPWSTASQQVLDYLHNHTAPDHFDQRHFSRLILGVLPTLAADERVRLMQETGRWFAVHAEKQANGVLNMLPTVRDRSQFASGVVGEMLTVDPHRAVKWATAVSDEYIAAILHSQIGRTWARNDLPAAIQWAQGMSGSRYQAEAIEGLVFTWTQVNVDAAFDWVLEMDQSEVQNRALSKMVKVISASNPESAAKWAAQLPESNQASESLSFAVQAWARRDVNASVTWLQSLEDSKILETVLRAVPMGWSDSEPAAAADWVMAWEGADEQQPQVLRSVVAKWGNTNPAEAIDWLERFPGKDVALRDVMVRELFENVAAKEPSEAKSLMEALASEELRKIASKAIKTTFSNDETD